MPSNQRCAVIGAGVTGLAVGAASGAPVFEQSDGPGGICRSYYLCPGEGAPLPHAPPSEGAYRFEVGGGHWIFGGDPDTLAALAQLAELRRYERRAVVRLGSGAQTVPYPLQGHLDALGAPLAATAAQEIAHGASAVAEATTLEAWLQASFGASLCQLFFLPFHDRYTAGLTSSIAPQDDYKSPRADRQGYNATFAYPVGGLDVLAERLGAACDIHYAKRLVGIDPHGRSLRFADGAEAGYDRLVSTLPLHQAVELAGLDLGEGPDPHTSVLVLNLGAERGAACPDAHWQYEADAASGFHRIGFYSNVDPEFLPADRRGGSHVSMYVERAYVGGQAPSADEVSAYSALVVDELTERGYIVGVDVVHPSWVDVAYTWRRPASRWRTRALEALADAGIEQVGRYARWHFQGIAESIRDGLAAGRALTR